MNDGHDTIGAETQTNDDPNRRTFLTRSAAALAAVAVGGAAGRSPAADQPAAARNAPNSPNAPATLPTRRANRIATSTYSIWRFNEGPKLTIEQCIEVAAAMGFDG